MPTRLCGNPPAYRFTWPGSNESVICAQCAPRLANIANAMGLPLQLQLVLPEQQVLTCPQNITVRTQP
jgi:hypothetical protein